MLFSSFPFVFNFLPAVILAFAAARRHSPRAGILVLLGASLFFYGAWKPIYLVLFLASIALNFSLGLMMESQTRRRAVGSFGVVINLAALCYFKYTNFLIDNFGAVIGAHLPMENIILPLGISFFTFQQIAYLVDVMRGAKVERDIVSYALFVSFFPHLIAGPLVHHAEMIPQFKRGRDGRSAVLGARGFAIFSAGLFKKVVVADNLAQFVTPVFAHLDAGGGVTPEWAWLSILAYTLQIYFDFSGYSDMAIGLALMFGIRLPVNFRSPYKSLSIIEFWRRWHITLSRFLRDYLYIPLGGNRHGALRRYINLLTTMLLGGLWHGAAWNFMIWGGLHGMFLAINHVLRGNASAKTSARWLLRLVSWMVTFAAVVLAWVFFRAATVGSACRALAGLIGVQSGQSAFVHNGIVRVLDLPILVGARMALIVGVCAVALSLATVLLLPNVPEIFRYREYRRAPEAGSPISWKPSAVWSIVVAVTFAIALFGMWQRMEFLYFQF